MSSERLARANPKRAAGRLDTGVSQTGPFQAGGKLTGSDGHQRVTDVQQLEGAARTQAVGPGEEPSRSQHPGDLRQQPVLLLARWHVVQLVKHTTAEKRSSANGIAVASA